MPLVRVEVRNEYGLGAPEMYAGANKDDPKEVLEGVAVAGLVGILRQLGDLAEFAAEVFHGLQEQVTITSSRSHKLMGRVKQIEAALPPLEKLVLAQRSHLHFAYTSGANWHVRRRCEQNHFIYSDLPTFIQDSYEQCKGPPQLNLLDKFDPGGPGSCLRRYSDPSFFRKASSGSEVAYSDKVLKDKKGRKIKKRSSRRNGEVSRGASISSHGRRMRFASLNMGGHSSPSQTVYTNDAIKSGLGNQPISLDSRNVSVDFDCASHPRSSMQHEEQEESSSSSSRIQNNDSHDYDYAFIDEKGASLFDDTRSSLSVEQTAPSLLSVTWNGKAEILEPASNECAENGISEAVCRNFNLENKEREPSNSETPEGYVCEMSLENSANIDLENEETDTCFETGKGYGHEVSLESFSTKSDIVDVNGVTHFDNGERYDHVESLVTYSGNIPRENEIGDTHSETAEGYDHNEPLQILSGVHDLETDDRGANEFGSATGYDHNEYLAMFSADLDRETLDSGAVLLQNASEMDMLHDNENLSMLVLDGIQPRDFKSETVLQKDFHLDGDNLAVSTSTVLQHEDVGSETDQDHYVDALNTIESECDTDLDCQTKEVEDDSDTESKANNGIDMFIKSNSESPIAASVSPSNNPLEDSSNSMFPKTCSPLYDSPDKVASEDVSSLDPCKSQVVPPPAEIANETLNSNCQTTVDSLQNGDSLGSPSTTVFSNVSSSNSRQHSSSVPVTDTTACSSELEKPPPEPSSISSVKFWTNGGLLGLEPSKPPDFTLLNVSTQVSLTSKEPEVGTSSPKSDPRDKRPENIEEPPITECSTSCQGDRKGGILTKKASWTSLSTDLSVNLQKLSDSCNQSHNNSSEKDCYSSNCGTVQPVPPDINSPTASQERSGNSSRMFEIGNRLLLNGFYRKSSLDKDETSNQTSSSNDGAFVRKSVHGHADHKTFSGWSKDMPGSMSPILSPASSPPLAHMKMLFQPVNGFEAPKLQLKFPEGNVGHEGERDLFPSFQLVPEATVPLHDGSDSDDDTFCRSSAYGSDCPSHESDSNSEQWESSESPRSKDQELYDALCRVSLTESISTSWETGATTQGERNKICSQQNSFTRHSLEHSPSGHLFDLPGLDSLHSSLEEEWRNHSHSKDHGDPHYPKELTPSPPPLPPPEWRAMKSQLEFAEGRQVSVTENLSHELDWKLGHTITQQPKPAPFKQEQIIEAAHTLKSKQLDLQKVRVQKEVYQVANRKEMEEKEDFLHQIRTKSFNLRRTASAKPAVSTGTPKNFQVTAILQKANAIRQAVGSDDGEDDNWSDT